jgi:hypothetical protein
METVQLRQQIAGILVSVCAVLLPVGTRYHVLASVGPGPVEYAFQIEFWIPLMIEVYPQGWAVVLSFGALGAFLPIFALAHVWVILQGVEMVRGRAVYCGIRNATLLAALVALIGFFPSFRLDWGNIPLPLILVFGLALAKWGTPRPCAAPFEGMMNESQD